MTEFAPESPTATIEPKPRWFTLAWLVPIAALVLAAVLIWQVRAEQGIGISIRFSNGDGIGVGSEVRYRGVQVGEVRDVTLRDDLKGVEVRVRIRPDARRIARAGTSFWIVKPEVSLTRVEGLDTLLGPQYIAADPGDGPLTTAFEGLNAPPRIAHQQLGALHIVLLAPSRGSVTVGSAVLYKEVQVGVVTGIRLAGDATNVEFLVRVEPDWKHLIRDNSRFWNASGIGLEAGIFSGLELRAGSLESVLEGAVGFATPRRPGREIDDGHVFYVESFNSDWIKWSPELQPSSSNGDRPDG